MSSVGVARRCETSEQLQFLSHILEQEGSFIKTGPTLMIFMLISGLTVTVDDSLENQKSDVKNTWT